MTAEKFYLRLPILQGILNCTYCNFFECFKLNNRSIYVCPDCGGKYEGFQNGWQRYWIRSLYSTDPDTRVEECPKGQMIIIHREKSCQNCRATKVRERQRKQR